MISGWTSTWVLGQVQNRLVVLRKALVDIEDLYAWISAQASTDLVGIGFNAADAAALQSAVADAHALAQLYRSGTLPASYTLPYVFSNSQTQVIGPQ